MSIVIQLDLLLKSKKMTSKQLAQSIGITEANLSILNSGKAKAIRFSTLEAICNTLDCQPGDILIYRQD
ncbi:TPA: helix-turn-helix domain-containing protein [Providencia alcalifaciens]